MTFDEYQKKALDTLIEHPIEAMNQTILAMGVAGEAGELIDKWKKIQGYYDGEVTKERLEGLSKEIGDVLWYLATFAHSLGLSLDDISKQNLAKLADRKNRDVLKSSGDYR